MATISLQYELKCSICLDLYTCPVMLDCGHNFCRRCIQQLAEEQTDNGSCPECRRVCTPEDLQRVNFKLGNIAEYYKSMQSSHSFIGLTCTYCIQAPSPAVSTCLHCEASFCRQHLDVHSKSKEHVLVEPTTSPQNRKCQIHNEVFKYFCKSDKSCICASCCLAGEHQGHPVEVLEKASLRKKEKLKKVIENLKSEQEVLKQRKNVLHNILKQKKENFGSVRKTIDAIYDTLSKSIVDTNVIVMNEVRRQFAQISKSIRCDISSVEQRAAKLSEDVEHVQAVCSKADPLAVLQDSVCSAICDKRISAQPSVDDKPASPAANIDMLLISLVSQKRLKDIVDDLPLFLSRKLACLRYRVTFLLNAASASEYLALSPDLKTALYSKKKNNREPSPDQFKPSQVLSMSSFSSGKYFWEVNTSKTGVKAIGVAYSTIERSGLKAYLGYSEKSWCLTLSQDYIEVRHNSRYKRILSERPTMRSIGVFLDYEAGLLSFYRICARVEHLYTFTVMFAEPIYPAFYVVNGWIKLNPQRIM
ncbi:tripartite motif-containing protein 75-like [Dendropsophus ebraccatus]|uniref:tripartite motif-containing protein 75-like n=1 Tax=Dendropsophus ebraccatus TaxID=150705 RepID=UPI0038315A62